MKDSCVYTEDWSQTKHQDLSSANVTNPKSATQALNINSLHSDSSLERSVPDVPNDSLCTVKDQAVVVRHHAQTELQEKEAKQMAGASFGVGGEERQRIYIHLLNL